MKILRTALYVAVAALAFGTPRQAAAQDIIEPMACPTYMINFWSGVQGRSNFIIYDFFEDWIHASTPGVSQAFFNLADPFHTPISADGRAKWIDPGHYTKCEKQIWFVPGQPGRIERVRDKYTTVYTEGYAEEISVCSGPEIIREPYDPYSPTGPNDPGDDCESPANPGGEGGGGGGGGMSCHTEYVIVEISNDGGATWEVYWEGYATVCE